MPSMLNPFPRRAGHLHRRDAARDRDRPGQQRRPDADTGAADRRSRSAEEGAPQASLPTTARIRFSIRCSKLISAFLRDRSKRPVFIILTTDMARLVAELRIPDYNKFVDSFRSRKGIAHAVVVRNSDAGMVTPIAENLVKNTGGRIETIAAPTAIPRLMGEIAAAGQRAVLTELAGSASWPVVIPAGRKFGSHRERRRRSRPPSSRRRRKCRADRRWSTAADRPSRAASCRER